MQINVQGKQMDVGESLRTHITTKLEDTNQKYLGRGVSAEVTIAPEGPSSYKTHIAVQAGRNIHVIGTATEHDVYASVDHAAERVAKQLRRYKKRLRDHHEHQENSPEIEIQKARDLVIAINQNEEEEQNHEDAPAIIAEQTKSIERLSVSDAVMRLDLSAAPFYLFKNAKSGALNVVYRREDGNIGWVDV